MLSWFNPHVFQLCFRFWVSTQHTRIWNPLALSIRWQRFNFVTLQACYLVNRGGDFGVKYFPLLGPNTTQTCWCALQNSAQTKLSNSNSFPFIKTDPIKKGFLLPWGFCHRAGDGRVPDRSGWVWCSVVVQTWCFLPSHQPILWEDADRWFFLLLIPWKMQMVFICFMLLSLCQDQHGPYDEVFLRYAQHKQALADASSCSERQTCQTCVAVCFNQGFGYWIFVSSI